MCGVKLILLMIQVNIILLQHNIILITKNFVVSFDKYLIIALSNLSIESFHKYREITFTISKNMRKYKNNNKSKNINDQYL